MSKDIQYKLDEINFMFENGIVGSVQQQKDKMEVLYQEIKENPKDLQDQNQKLLMIQNIYYKLTNNLIAELYYNGIQKKEQDKTDKIDQKPKEKVQNQKQTEVNNGKKDNRGGKRENKQNFTQSIILKEGDTEKKHEVTLIESYLRDNFVVMQCINHSYCQGQSAFPHFPQKEIQTNEKIQEIVQQKSIQIKSHQCLSKFSDQYQEISKQQQQDKKQNVKKEYIYPDDYKKLQEKLININKIQFDLNEEEKNLLSIKKDDSTFQKLQKQRRQQQQNRQNLKENTVSSQNNTEVSDEESSDSEDKIGEIVKMTKKVSLKNNTLETIIEKGDIEYEEEEKDDEEEKLISYEKKKNYLDEEVASEENQEDTDDEITKIEQICENSQTPCLVQQHCKYTLNMKISNKKYIIFIPGLEANITGCLKCGGWQELFTDSYTLKINCSNCGDQFNISRRLVEILKEKYPQQMNKLKVPRTSSIKEDELKNDEDYYERKISMNLSNNQKKLITDFRKNKNKTTSSKKSVLNNKSDGIEEEGIVRPRQTNSQYEKKVLKGGAIKRRLVDIPKLNNKGVIAQNSKNKNSNQKEKKKLQFTEAERNLFFGK